MSSKPWVWDLRGLGYEQSPNASVKWEWTKSFVVYLRTWLMMQQSTDVELDEAIGLIE